MRLALCLSALALCACEPARPQAEIPPAPPPPGDDPAARYAEEVVGRWAADAACAERVWTFAADGVTAPGNVRCLIVDPAEGPGGALRVAAAQCYTGPSLWGDVVVDLTTGGDTLTIEGVFTPLPTETLRRCD